MRPLLALLGVALAGPSPSPPKEPPRNLARAYELRAYGGAPPVYTHAVEGDVEAVPEACLSCHRRGTSGAPVSPHPELVECRQCHVMRKTRAEFRPTEFTAPPAPALGRRALPTAPAVMPHLPVGFRTRCSTCHGPPNPARELATPHPERTLCNQCHVPARTSDEWSRPLDGAGPFR